MLWHSLQNQFSLFVYSTVNWNPLSWGHKTWQKERKFVFKPKVSTPLQCLTNKEGWREVICKSKAKFLSERCSPQLGSCMFGKFLFIDGFSCVCVCVCNVYIIYNFCSSKWCEKMGVFENNLWINPVTCLLLPLLFFFLLLLLEMLLRIMSHSHNSFVRLTNNIFLLKINKKS